MVNDDEGAMPVAELRGTRLVPTVVGKTSRYMSRDGVGITHDDMTTIDSYRSLY